MTTYFDAALDADKNLLPPSTRGHAELALVAALAEAAVIAWYTENPPAYMYTAADVTLHGTGAGAGATIGATDWGSGEDITASTTGAAPLRVYLQGYKSDASDPDVDPNLKQALRISIAFVIRWWVSGWGREPGIQSASDVAGKSRAFRENAEDVFPPGWDMWLVPFDIRPVPWGL